MKHVQLKWNQGEEAICPECHHQNACLNTGSIGKAMIYECRDCHEIYVVDNGLPSETIEIGKKLVIRDAITVKRSLGKTCSGCGSFNIRHLNFEEMRELNKNAKQPWERKEYICSDCDKLWG